MAGGSNQLSDPQAAVIAFLSDAATHPGADRVDRIETHGNIIFLAGAYAWKIKRAVRFPYMDFSTLDLRHRACLEEMAANVRLAPALYIACVPITRDASGNLAIAGEGEAVDWAVKMHRFEQGDLLSARASAGPLPQAVALAVADAVHASHQGADVEMHADGAGNIGSVLGNLVAALRGLSALSQPLVEALADRASSAHARAAPLLDRRAAAGFVRRCHGDLHAANIVLWKGRPMLYDAIEFDPAIATIDTLYDLAFLLMDLDRRGQREAANLILNRMLWLGRNDLDLEGLAALPLFLALRAGVRALVTAERALQEPPEAAQRSNDAAHALLQAASGYLDTPAPLLMAVAGLSGTGKSTLAQRLSPWLGAAPGAVHLRTDLIRKSLAGVAATDRLPAACYTPDAAQRVYGELQRQARLVLAAGHSVVADGVSLLPEEQHMLRDLAMSCGVGFCGLWLTAPPDVLVARVSQRKGDASDATAEVVRRQLDMDATPATGWLTIDASGSADTTLSRARAALRALVSQATGPDP